MSVPPVTLDRDRVDAQILELERKIAVERKVKQGAEAIMKQLSDKAALTAAQLSLDEANKRLEFLQGELLKTKNLQRSAAYLGWSNQGMPAMSLNQGVNTPSSGGQSPSLTSMRQIQHPAVTEVLVDDYYYSSEARSRLSSADTLSHDRLHNSNNTSNTWQAPTTVPPPVDDVLGDLPMRSDRGASLTSTATRKSSLDLYRQEVGLSADKIAVKVAELQYKIEVEQRVRAGATKIVDAYKKMGATSAQDKKTQQDAEQSLAHAKAKVALLKVALNKYQSLNVDGMIDPVPTSSTMEEDPLQTQQKRVLVTGRLKIHIEAARALTVASTSHAKHNEGYCAIRIDNVLREKTKLRPKLHWNEDLTLFVDRAFEIEFSVYDKQDSLQSLFFFRLGELLTRPQTEDGIVRVDGLFDLEPQGGLELSIVMDRIDGAKKQRKSQLRRRNVIKRKQHVVAGHKFVAAQFYQVVKCAFCSEFLLSAAGYQCEACKYVCHKRCHEKVLYKCISHGTDESVNDSRQALKYNIPHRMETVSVAIPTWCGHCGIMIPLGRKSVKRCTECHVSAHSHCATFLPDFCGMSAQLASQLLAANAMPPKKPSTSSLASQAGHVTPGNAVSTSAAVAHSGTTTPTAKDTMSHLTASTASLDLRASPAATTSSKKPTSTGSKFSLFNAFIGSSREALATPSANAATIVPQPESNIKKANLNDFHFVAVLGKGNFGKVMLAEEKSTKKLYAIKVLKKQFIIENDEIESVQSEKRIFLTANRGRMPFLVGLHSCFQNETRIFFVMEYVSGGDLMLHIQREQFTEKRAKFYAAEVLLALEYFHKNHIVYRDLKLDNILLAPDGHVKIADYGLCKENMWADAVTNTFCGTPEFMAPEILLEKDYGRAVDWWALGVLIYEMLLGQSPFSGEDEDEIFSAILHNEVLYPPHLPRDAVSILQRLLTKDPKMRLGSSPNDADDIKRHPFFKGTDWEAMLAKRIPPPFVPKIKSPTDVSNFDEEFTTEQPQLTPMQSAVLHESEQEEFKHFSYVADWAGMAS